VTRLWVGQCGVQFPAGVRDFVVFRSVQAASRASSASYLMGTEGLFPQGKSGQTTLIPEK